MEFRFTDPANLKSIREATEQSLRIFGQTLKKALDPTATDGFSKSYILQLEDGRRPCTPALEQAYRRIAAALDDSDPALATARETMVYATNDISGALITGKAIQCARPGCKVRFVPNNPLQKYHSPDCQREYAAIRKAANQPAQPSGSKFLGSVQWQRETQNEWKPEAPTGEQHEG